MDIFTIIVTRIEVQNKISLKEYYFKNKTIIFHNENILVLNEFQC